MAMSEVCARSTGMRRTFVVTRWFGMDMARIRTIKPEFPQSESMGQVSRDARLAFILLWTICDDAGKARGSSRMLASLLFPYDNDAPAKIDGWLAELERAGCVERYAADDAHYIRVRNWLVHQKIDRPSPSKFPDPRECSRGLDESSRRFVAGSKDLDQDLDQDLDREGTRTEEGSEAAPQPSLPPSAPPAPSALMGPEPDLSSLAYPLFPCVPGRRNKSRTWLLSNALMSELSVAFPAVDVSGECRRAHQWVKANPSRRKTADGMRDFLRRWMAKEQVRGGRRAGSARRDPRGTLAAMQEFLESKGVTP